MKPVIVALGDEDHRDDGAGPALAAAIDARAPGEFVVVLPDDDPAAVLDALGCGTNAVVVDAVISGAPPGFIHRFDKGDALPAPPPMSTHGFDLGEALALARALGRLPEHLVVYGIEAADLGPGRGLSPEVARAVDELATLLVAERKVA